MLYNSLLTADPQCFEKLQSEYFSKRSGDVADTNLLFITFVRCPLQCFWYLYDKYPRADLHMPSFVASATGSKPSKKLSTCGSSGSNPGGLMRYRSIKHKDHGGGTIL